MNISKRYIEMGAYYSANPYGLVKTVCKIYHYESGESMIAYVNVGKGGVASEVFAMPENEFKNIFLH